MRIDRAAFVYIAARRGLRQGAIAEGLGVSGATLSEFVNGRRPARAEFVERLAVALGCAVEDLLAKEEVARG